MPSLKKKQRPQNVKLHATLEKLVLRAAMQGQLSPALIKDEELSPLGARVRGAIEELQTRPGVAVGMDAVVMSLLEHGTSELEARSYLREVVMTDGGTSAEALLKAVRDKHTVTDLMNMAAEQLGSGSVSVDELLSYLRVSASGATVDPLLPVGAALQDGFPPVPKGLPLVDFPELTEHTGGLMGMWAVAGGPGTGKSTLAWQLALGLSPTPVLLYDFENGLPVLLGRTREMYDGDVAAVRRVVNHVYHRDSITTFEVDLARIPPPAVVIVDSVQKLPASLEHRRTSLDQWIYRFEALKKLGYNVLLVSEVNRASYQGQPNMGAFKETGEIEYTVDVGIQLRPWGTPGAGYVEVFVVKNRHRPVTGSVGVWGRFNSWTFREGMVAGSSLAEEPTVQDNPFANWEPGR